MSRVDYIKYVYGEDAFKIASDFFSKGSVNVMHKFMGLNLITVIDNENILWVYLATHKSMMYSNTVYTIN